jgi:site-specific DNA recombinase
LRIVSDELWHNVQGRLRAARGRAHATNLRGRPARHLLSGLLVCNCCGAHYTVRNGKAYTCSSSSNGRDVLCTQRTYLPRGDVETTLLEGIKAQLAAPKVVRERERQIRLAARKPSGPDPKVELAALDKQIADLADTIIAVGKSDVLTAKLRELEKQKRALAQQAPRPAALLTGASDQWRELVTNLEHLGKYARPDEMELARAVIHDYIGEVSVIEDSRGVYGLVRMSNGAGYKSGAQDALPDLYLERIPLRLK